ncbi:MAG TPA: hypothetical protein VFT06_00325 [Flavisolibacter sp.]|nr:hypothetical protein [Flavisolibacter sp.]
MIQANELRIGNWIIQDSMYAKVMALDENEITIDSYPLRYAAKPAAFDPIPLTPEILEKCGFKRLYDKSTYPNSAETWSIKVSTDFDHYLSIDIVTGNSELILENFEGSQTFFLPDIEYIHQLQNLYFALTGTELEIKSPL